MHKPTKVEIEDHERSHCPFQPWCRRCVKARASNAQHRGAKDKDDKENQSKVPKVSMDLFFMSRKDEVAKQNSIIGMLDDETGEKYARAVGHKGIGKHGETGWLIQDMVAELKPFGYSARAEQRG